MIEILESPDHLVAMKISGSITAEDIDRAYKATEGALKNSDRVSFFAEIGDSLSFTIEGLLKDLWEAVGHIGQMSKYYRAAVVTDKSWIGAAARLEGLVFSNIDVRVFTPNERAKAFGWASATPPALKAPEPPQPSIHLLHTNSSNVIAWEIDGRIREQDIKTAVEHIKPLFEKEGKINALVRIKNYGGFDLLAVLDDDLIKLKFKSASKIEKYAIVGGAPWMRNFLELMNGVVATEIKVFDTYEEERAWEWVGAQQAALPE
ncbi:STAS/SEC14 domain-containing protein [Leptolyngbya sp. 7M]|uniref:STAS/SEC14 domain-containing protein n=1 Tax=Leptolyngbya sp. 7M TaxID=2812896 RepID=UPI001B8A999A|nr:STAS/SEC14 domain-containing protein [Leptolyngbya sp. 7M]QYO65552.1 STAS/SEC14 domain-containing protein [Leptolyngbya sp. 7M]